LSKATKYEDLREIMMAPNEEDQSFLEDGFEEEYELEFPIEFFHEPTSLEQFIYYHAEKTITEKGVLLSSCVVFEFLDENGTLRASVLHKTDVSKATLAAMLYSAFKNLGEQEEDFDDDAEPYNPKDF
jgi:hypothetical protein